jgi:hypothetical protein
MIASSPAESTMNSRVPLRKLRSLRASATHSPASMSGRALDVVPREEAIISNVIISNDCTCVGVFENPANAHIKYIRNNPVANAIAHGSDTLKNAKGVFCAK